MKYLIRDPNTKTVDLQFDTPITPHQGIEVIEVPDAQYKIDMLGSIFQSVNIYKPYPSNGDWWVSNGTDWVDPRTDDKVWERVRSLRDEELLKSDWTQLDDSQLTPPQKGLWTAYRQVLRNVPNNNPNNPRAAETALENAMANDKPSTGRSG